MKKCPFCVETKPFSEFYKSKAAKDGCSSYCKICANAKAKKYKEDNKEKVAARYAEYQKKNKEKINEYNRSWNADNKEKRDSYVRAWQEKNPDRVKELVSRWQKSNKGKVSAKTRAYQKRNPDKMRAKGAKKLATKLNATPTWLTEQHFQDMKNVYTHARECETLTGDPYHVDHIVPLRGETVCGLHVPWNLQVLPADINLSKSNTYNDWQD